MSKKTESQTQPYQVIINDVLLKQRAIDYIGDGVVITDPCQQDNPIVYCNLAFELLTGYKSEEIIGKNCRFLQGKKTNSDTVQAIQKAIENCAVFSGEILNYRKNGRCFWNHLTISPVFDDAGDITHFVGVQRDVTLMVDMRSKFNDKAKENHVLKLTVKSLIKQINEQEEGLLKSGD